MAKVSLGELSAALGDCLRVFQEASPDGRQVAAVEARLRPIYSKLFEQNGLEGSNVDQGELANTIIKQVVELGGALADWGGRVAQVSTTPSWDAAQRQFALAELAVRATYELMSFCGCGSDTGNLFRWARCAGAALGGGRELLVGLLEAAGGAGSSVRRTFESRTSESSSSKLLGIGRKIVGHQLRLVHDAVTAVSTHGRTEAAFAAAVATPSTVGPWLSVVATVLRLAKEAGADCHTTLLRFATLASALLTWRAGDAYSRHQEAMAAAPAQQAALAALLPHVLAAVNTELDRHEGNGSGVGSSGSDARHAGSALIQATCALQLVGAPCCDRGLQRLLHAGDPGGIALAGFSLFQRVPLQRPAVLDADEHGALLAAAAAACGQMLNVRMAPAPDLGRFAEAARQANRRALQALPTLARMAAKLQERAEQRAAEGATDSAPPRGVLPAFAHGASQAARRAFGAALAEQVPWGDHCALANATLAALQLVRWAVATAGAAGASLAASCLRLVSSMDVLSLSVEGTDGECEPAEPEAQSRLAQRLRAAVAAACSLLHFLAACSDAQLATLPPSWPVHMVASLGWLLGYLYRLSTAAVPPRQLQACAAAVLAATPAALQHLTNADGAGTAIAGMTQALQVCPAWLHSRGGQATWTALERAVRSLLQSARELLALHSMHSLPLLQALYLGELPTLREVAESILPAAAACPRVAAALASSSLLGEIVEGCFGTFPAAVEQAAQNGDGHDSEARQRYLAHLQALLNQLSAVLASLAQAVEQARQEGSPAIPAEAAAAAATAAAFEVPQLAAEPAAGKAAAQATARRLLPLAAQLAAALQAHWQQPEQRAAAALEVARAAATRGCAYLRCPNLAAAGNSGGLDAGQVPGSKRCGGCRVAHYCGTACSHADWREGHRGRVCRVLAAERAAIKARQREQAAAG